MLFLKNWFWFYSYDNLPEVSIRDISQAHLISYHPDKDLLPMAMASCNYSFEMGKDAQTDYNFKDLERQIMDKFLFSKSKIKIKEVIWDNDLVSSNLSTPFRLWWIHLVVLLLIVPQLFFHSNDHNI